ncbi:MAG: histidine phosphatase family protein [Patescibacteria group bacterium]|nr:histidine phosphatase family protein [Patescibacteria group bacterium]MDD4304758.1 histidine phosphatase family protein [Patescibacteria group bacterium]MDD4695769.1 histidine phosphatase family protein [Patescibacteria group bacterium]
MLKIYLTRHGQDKDNANGILNGRRNEDLTEIGINQAKELVGKIKTLNIHFDFVYSSPLIRTYHTAEIICEDLKLDNSIKLDELIERDFGIMTGNKVSDIEKLCAPDIIKSKRIVYFLYVPKCESFEELQIRANKFLDFIKNKHKNGNILLVTHGDFGKMLYACYYNLKWEDVFVNFEFGNSELLLLSENSKPEDTHIFEIDQYNV